VHERLAGFKKLQHLFLELIPTQAVQVHDPAVCRQRHPAALVPYARCDHGCPPLVDRQVRPARLDAIIEPRERVGPPIPVDLFLVERDGIQPVRIDVFEQRDQPLFHLVDIGFLMHSPDGRAEDDLLAIAGHFPQHRGRIRAWRVLIALHDVEVPGGIRLNSTLGRQQVCHTILRRVTAVHKPNVAIQPTVTKGQRRSVGPDLLLSHRLSGRNHRENLQHSYNPCHIHDPHLHKSPSQFVALKSNAVTPH